MLSSSPAVIHQAHHAPVQPVLLHNHVLRKKYRDPLKLKQALTKTFGEGNYKIKVRIMPSSIADGSGFRFAPLLTLVCRNRSGLIGGLWLFQEK